MMRRSLKVTGWGLAVMLALFAGLTLLTEGGVPMFDPGFDLYDLPRNKWPDGGLEVGLVPGALDDIGGVSG